MKTIFRITAIFWISLASFATEIEGRLTPTGFLSLDVQDQTLDIAFYESGGELGAGVLLLPGNTSSANSYANVFVQPYAESHRLVAIDLPGFGRSSDAITYDAALMRETIAEAATALDLDEGVIVGWSLGGDLALQASGQLPDVQGYFLVGTAPLGVAPDLPPPFLLPEESYAGEAVTYGFIAALTKAQIRDFVNAFFRPTFPSSQIANHFYRDGFRTDPDTRAAVLAAAIGADPTFMDEVVIVRTFDKPIVLAVGDTDAFLNQDYLTALAPSVPTLFKSEIHVFQDTGHAVHWERPHRFIQLLKQFIASLP